MQVVATRSLVGYEDNDTPFLFFLETDHLADCIVLLDAERSELGTQSNEQIVEGPVVEGTIDLIEIRSGKRMRGTGEPFPIAIMSHEHDDERVSLILQLVDQFRILEFGPLQQFLQGDVCQFEGFNHIVCKVMVEGSFKF